MPSQLTDRLRHPLILSALALGSCATPSTLRTLDVIGTDYAFTVRDTVDAGASLVSFSSRGLVRHELALARLRDGVSSAEAADSLMHGRSMRNLRATGSAVLFAAPGQTDNPVRLSVTFERGKRYALWCQFRDSSSAPKHQVLGMFKILTVR